MEALLDYFINNHDKFLYLLAGLCLTIELTVIGLSGPLLFVGIACAFTGIFVQLGFLDSWQAETVSVGLGSLLSAALLWKPLKGLTSEGKVQDQSSDMIGQVVPVGQNLDKNSGSIRHSGIDWQARLNDPRSDLILESGTRVKIVGVEGTTMLIEALN